MSQHRIRTIVALMLAMDAMQEDPKLECVDTLALMEEAISDALFYFTGERRWARDQNARKEPHP